MKYDLNEIKKDVYWTGYLDWELKVFHGYSTPHGSTYNSYLLLDEKPTLIDTVKHYGFKESLDRIEDIIDPRKIEYIISNHTEMDHSGTIDELLDYCPNAQVVCSPKGEEGLKRHFKKRWRFKVVHTGDELDIGKRKLQFVLMPMVHWPDSMATYSSYDKILFPNDAFGQHIASNERFVDEKDQGFVFQEAAKYYGNIVMPYGAQVLKTLDVLSSIDFDMICPSHGLCWRKQEDIQKIIECYKKWASYETENKVLIVYDTMWHSTEKMAFKLNEILKEEGVVVKMMNLQDVDISDIVTEVLTSKFVLFGTPILNNCMLPSMASLLMYLKGLKPKNRYAFTFGSYGWATIGFKEVEEFIKEAGFELMDEGKYLKFIPDEKELMQLASIVSIIKEKIKG